MHHTVRKWRIENAVMYEMRCRMRVLIGRLLLVSLCFAVGACAVPSADVGRRANQVDGKPSDPLCESDMTADERLKMQVIDQTIEQGRLYAAFAQLDSLRDSLPQVRFRKAQIMRRLRNDEADEMYRGLLGGCLDGYARHGIGLIATATGDVERGVEYLAQARQQLPVDAAVRNDYGYALLLAGDVRQAHFELNTALELHPEDKRAASNLLLLFLSEGQSENGIALINQYAFSKSDVDAVEKQLSVLSEYRSAQAVKKLMSDDTDGAKNAEPRAAQLR